MQLLTGRSLNGTKTSSQTSDGCQPRHQNRKAHTLHTGSRSSRCPSMIRSGTIITPGDRWNCKCSLEATDEPVNRPDDMEPTKPQRGLENNPGKDGHTFSDKHPYFPSDCSHCFAYKKGGFSNRLKALFLNREKDCYNCPFIYGCLHRQEEKKHIDMPANVLKQHILDNGQMPLSGDIKVPTLSLANYIFQAK